ncbi:MAG: helix-turn-helix domain-containing protein [Treponema sp.]
MQDIGNVLETARSEKQIGLEQAARETNIARRYLEALETGRYDVFPGEPYIVGFLRNYAEYLGLNPDECVLLYKQAKIQETDIPPEKLIPQRRFTVPRGVFIFAGIIVLLAVLFFAGRIVFEKIGTALKNRPAQPAEQTRIIEKTENAAYILSTDIFQKRVFTGDTLTVPIAGKEYHLKIEKTAPELHLNTDIGTQIIALGQSLVLDLNGDVSGDIKISVEDLDKSDETKGAFIAAVMTGIPDIPDTADIKVSEQSTHPETAKYKVLFDAGSAYPVTLNATFRSYCLFRYEQDRTNRDERYYQKSEQLTIQANNGIRIWASNGNAVKMQIIAGGKTIDIEVSRPGEVIVKDFKWLKDDESGRYKFVVMEVD